MAKRSDLIFPGQLLQVAVCSFPLCNECLRRKLYLVIPTYYIGTSWVTYAPKLVAPMSSFLFDLTIGMTGRGLTLRKPSCILPCWADSKTSGESTRTPVCSLRCSGSRNPHRVMGYLKQQTTQQYSQDVSAAWLSGCWRSRDVDVYEYVTLSGAVLLFLSFFRDDLLHQNPCWHHDVMLCAISGMKCYTPRWTEGSDMMHLLSGPHT